MSNNKTCGECQYLYTPDWTTCLLDGSHIVRDKPACERFKQKIRDTNGDRIRAMRDEELAELITQPLCYCCGYNVDCFGNCNRPAEMSCEDAILEWLKKEVNNE